MVIDYENITIRKRCLVERGSILIGESKLNVITGKNGSGKTLFAKYLFHKLSSHGRDAVYVEQDNFPIINGLDVYGNIFINEDSTYAPTIKAWIKDRGFSYIFGRDANNLSGGEKRLVALLRALASDAEVVILDEPTNDLDYTMVDALCGLLNECKKRCTLIAITHDDRMTGIADSIFNIENQSLSSRMPIPMRNEGSANNNTAKRTRILADGFLHKVIKRQYFSVAIILLLFPFMCVEALAVQEAKTTAIPYMHPGQVNIFLPISSYAAEHVKGGEISTLALAALNPSQGDGKSEILENATKQSELMSIVFGLELESGENYNVRVIERYNPSDRSYLLWDDDIASRPESLENSFIVVDLLNNYSFYDFIQSSAFEPLTQANYSICSNETIELVNEINFAKFLKSAFVNVIMSCALSLLLYFLYLTIYFRLSKRVLVNLRNYGYSQKNIQTALIGRFNNKKIFLTFSLVCLFANILISRNTDVVLGYFPSIVVAAMLVAIHSMQKGVIKNKVKRVFNWRFR
jgi:ABC-type lipoprotein export system ATPase subunit